MKTSPRAILRCFLIGVTVLIIVSTARLIGFSKLVQARDISGLSSGYASWMMPVAYSFSDTLGDAANSIYELYRYYILQQELQPDDVERHISHLVSYVRSQPVLLEKYLPESYAQLKGLLYETSAFDKDIPSLLGFSAPQTYIVVLQNSAESRPNGGFFGSFMVVKVDDGKVAKMEIIDSYLINRENPQAVLDGPAWLTSYLPHNQIHFVGANKIGFTYHDGAHIELLYEKAYPNEDIRGVFFIRSELFEELIPGFQKQFEERQFANAATDLIRGAEKFGKKERYLSEVSSIVTDYKDQIISSLLTKLPELIAQNSFNIYLTRISGGLHTWLRKKNLTTRFEDSRLYLRETNTSYNKVDTYITKQVMFASRDGAEIVSTTGEDVFDISGLGPGEYTLSVDYMLDVPDEYMSRMRQLESDFQIELTERETHILGLVPSWKNRSLLYIPPNFSIDEIRGASEGFGTFTTPFSNVGRFTNQIESNGEKSRVEIDFRVE